MFWSCFVSLLTSSTLSVVLRSSRFNITPQQSSYCLLFFNALCLQTTFMS